MDFFRINESIRVGKKGTIIDISPDWIVGRSKDLMVRGGAFYAVWNPEKELWSKDEYDVQRLVDDALLTRKAELEKEHGDSATINVKLTGSFQSNGWLQFRKFASHIPDSSELLDNNIVFSNMKPGKKDYASKKLPYPLEEGKTDAYEEIISTLYDPSERAKIEWAIGAIISGDSKDIQKFIVLYGEPGGGKSTLLNIIQKLFVGYYTTFDAKSLVSSSNGFATEAFRNNPLIAIQHDGDLSRIEDNTKLNSIVSHEEMVMNEKYKASYSTRTNCFLFMATNQPVKISDSKAGLTRRLIDVNTSGRKIPTSRYHILMSRIDFELGAIAFSCLKTYRAMGKNYYSKYKPVDMMFRTDVFFNFVEENYHIFKEQDGTTVVQAYQMYKTYCDETGIDARVKLPRYKFRDELKNYFERFDDLARVDGKQVRSYYSGFKTDKFKSGGEEKASDIPTWLSVDKVVPYFEETFGDSLAQYASEDLGIPSDRWNKIKTTLKDLDRTKLHYVRLPENHIVIDFDLRDESGEKSAEKNLEAAGKWPATYAEFSKSGKGVHLHYIYEGDTSKLKNIYSEGIEIKVFTGLSALRRMYTRSNDIPVATINSGLPLKEEEKHLINFDTVKSEKALRDLIERNLRKEIHPGTKPSMDFIHKILQDAYDSGLKYDVSDLRPRILAFAAGSSHQSDYSIKLVGKIKFKSEEPSAFVDTYKSDALVFFDVEVFPNLFVVCWKYQGNSPCVSMVNPQAKDIEDLIKMKLVGFNNRRYDNHILYARYIGYTNEQLFNLSQRIVGEGRGGLFSEAYNLSFADVYDFSSEKKSLKRFQIDLGIVHKELGIPWDKPVDEKLWPKVVEYCNNDVISLEKVFESRKQDFVARKILADLSGLSVNDSTQMHTAKIIFGNDPKPQDQFVYTDLSEMFPGYIFENGKSTYRGEEPGEGGYVYAEPGMYTNVYVGDVVSMHPKSLELLNHFGPYTKRFVELREARVAIKHKDYDKARGMLNGVLTKYLTSPEQSKDLAYALKIVINIVYGLTSASFDNKFRDKRNRDNIVAKRGALFMIDLKHAVQERGFTVAHIKTDSIKIPNATPEIIDFVTEFGKKYGYEFENEATYEKMALVNDAVYIAKTISKDRPGVWEATGAQFAHPYVFKRLFSKEKITFSDLCEVKAVSTALYLDMNEGLGEDAHDYRFIGKVSSFCPIKPGRGGGILLREKDGKYSAATGTKGYRWLESETISLLGKEDDIDLTYFDNLVEDAVSNLKKFGDTNWFLE